MHLDVASGARIAQWVRHVRGSVVGVQVTTARRTHAAHALWNSRRGLGAELGRVDVPGRQNALLNGDGAEGKEQAEGEELLCFVGMSSRRK